MLRAGFSHRQATMYISFFNVFIIAIAFLLDGIGILWLGLVLLGLCMIATHFVAVAVKKRETIAREREIPAAAPAPTARASSF